MSAVVCVNIKFHAISCLLTSQNSIQFNISKVLFLAVLGEPYFVLYKKLSKYCTMMPIRLAVLNLDHIVVVPMHWQPLWFTESDKNSCFCCGANDNLIILVSMTSSYIYFLSIKNRLQCLETFFFFCKFKDNWKWQTPKTLL